MSSIVDLIEAVFHGELVLTDCTGGLLRSATPEDGGTEMKYGRPLSF
jgi:hypothetical protein